MTKAQAKEYYEAELENIDMTFFWLESRGNLSFINPRYPFADAANHFVGDSIL